MKPNETTIDHGYFALRLSTDITTKDGEILSYVLGKPVHLYPSCLCISNNIDTI